jgi:hypothetical protein
MRALEAAPRPDGAVRSKAFPAIKASWRAHVDRPWIPALVLCCTAVIALLSEVLDGAKLTPQNLARLSGLPPLDAYGVLAISANQRLLIPILIFVKASITAMAIAGMTRSGLSLRSMAKAALLYAGAALSIYLLALVGLLYANEKSKAILLGEATPLLPTLLTLEIVGYVLLTVIFSSLVARAATGERPSPKMSSLTIWAAAAISSWLWLFLSKSSALADDAVGYAFAFGLILTQSVLLGVVAFRAGD